LSAEKTPMRKIREVLRLKWTSQLSNRTIANSCSIARSTVAECLERASKAGLSWPLPDNMDDAELERLLYRNRQPEPILPAPPVIAKLTSSVAVSTMRRRHDVNTQPRMVS
jgi:hypothetical protein